MVQEVLQNCHDSLEGGHQGVVRTYQRVKKDYYWSGSYSDVDKHVRSCSDCSTSKSRPQLRGYSPGNILAERPFQIVSMDFVIPLPKSRRGNTALLLLQCAFTGYVIAKAMADTSALKVTQAFEECVYRRFCAPSMIQHDRDPRFMNEVFQTFDDMMQARSRATLSYRPQANDQQERLVKSAMASVRVYVEDPLQQDWDELVERLIFAINNSMDTTRKETPFYLVHGWDARSTLRAMTSMGRGLGRQSDARAWRREASRQQEIALAMAKEKRAKKHIDALSRMEKASLRHGEPSDTSGDGSSDQSNDAGATRPNARSPFEVGSRAWLYMGRVNPGLVKKLAHLWHGPFRIKAKVEEFAYALELPDRRGYRFHPVVHVSRLKPVTEFEDRPAVRLAPEVAEKHRTDFDEELLPEDSWEQEPVTDEFEAEAILDDRVPVSTGTERPVREFKIMWAGYDEPSWEPVLNLSCGGLLYDYLLERKRDRRLQIVQVADEV
ncbi:hypothetical protein PI125_g24670 [Phytophthora idaei]|nr:hypothetical protein PI125_g24670 [Phytophthora idaei]